MGDIAAIVPAAGRGRRLGAERNKLFLDLCGQPILAHTLRALQEALSDRLQDIVIPLAPDDRAAFSGEVRPHLRALPPVRLVAGGDTRQQSVANALATMSSVEWILVHDGARPLVSKSLLMRTLSAAREHGVAVAAVPLQDTVKVVDATGRVRKTLPRDQLRAIQTPQVFAYEILERAHREAAAAGFQGTDDAALLEWLAVSVYVVPGDVNNLKITTATDLQLAHCLLQTGGDASGR